MLKRVSLVFMLLMALVGITGVQAQTAAPQTMAQYLPADADLFFAMRTDEAYMDELTGLIRTVGEKLPGSYANTLNGFNIRLLLSTQIGSLETIGVGDYVAASVSDVGLLYDRDYTNDNQVAFYGVLALTDAAKFEVFVERISPTLMKTDENGVTVYSNANGTPGKVFITPDAAYFTNRETLPSGDRLDSSSQFNDTVSRLPEPSYNVVIYADLESIFQGSLSQMTAQDRIVLTSLGFDLENLGPIAIGGTVVDGKSLVIDAYNGALNEVMSSVSPIDSGFTAVIPSGTSYVMQATDFKTTFNTTLDLIYLQDTLRPTPTLPSREYLNAQSKAFFGLDMDSDILDWMEGNYILIGDLNVLPLLEAQARGETVSLSQDLRFAFIVQGDGSDKPAKVVQGVGNWLVLQGQHEPSGPQATLSTTGDLTSVVIENVPVSGGADEAFTLEMAGNPDLLVFGDQVTVQAILSGTGDSLRDDPAFLEAQMYALPNASAIMYADGEGWGNFVSGWIVATAVSEVIFQNVVAGLTAEQGSPTPTPIPTENLITPMLPLAAAGYKVISSSSISTVVDADGAQLTRLVLTLK